MKYDDLENIKTDCVFIFLSFFFWTPSIKLPQFEVILQVYIDMPECPPECPVTSSLVYVTLSYQFNQNLGEIDEDLLTILVMMSYKIHQCNLLIIIRS